MPTEMVKPAAIVAGLTILLAGYIAGIIYKIMPTWLALCLSPFALMIAIAVLIALGAYTFLIIAIVSDRIVGGKISFLNRYGTETQAEILQVEHYTGPGLHSGDPCYRGRYTFTDQKGRTHTFGFKGECYDPYDIASLGISLDTHYKSGAKRRITYLSWFPAFHHLHPPNIAAPIVQGSATGLHKLK